MKMQVENLDETLRKLIVENIDFRKTVNDYLFPNGHTFKEYKDNFNWIYDIGNKYVHPKVKEQYNFKEDALEAVNKLRHIINNLKTIFNEYDYIDGKRIKKKIERFPIEKK